MQSDLQTLKNVGPRVEACLLAVGIDSVETFRQTGAFESARRILHSGEMKPHILLYQALVGAEQNRNIFSFDPTEKLELKTEYQEILNNLF